MKEVTTDGKRSDVQVLGLKARKERTRERKKERKRTATNTHEVAARPFYDFQGMIRNDWWMDTRYRQFGPDVQESYYQRPQQVRDLTISR